MTHEITLITTGALIAAASWGVGVWWGYRAWSRELKRTIDAGVKIAQFAEEYGIYLEDPAQTNFAWSEPIKFKTGEDDD